MSLIEVMSIVFKVIAYIIGILSLYFLLDEDTWIVAATLMVSVYPILFISGRLEVHEMSKNVTWSLYQRSD